jgi:predicted RNA-binding Zn-ribbon protein involved in translation (DUF1610 family)
VSHARGKFHKAVFCPWCGVEGVVRDDYQNPNKCKVEFICPTCGVSYRLLDSTRRQAANHLFAEDRRLRLPSKAKDRYRMLCAQMFKQIKKYYRETSKEQTRARMKEWLNSEEAVMARLEMETEKRELSK